MHAATAGTRASSAAPRTRQPAALGTAQGTRAAGHSAELTGSTRHVVRRSTGTDSRAVSRLSTPPLCSVGAARCHLVSQARRPGAAPRRDHFPVQCTAETTASDTAPAGARSSCRRAAPPLTGMAHAALRRAAILGAAHHPHTPAGPPRETRVVCMWYVVPTGTAVPRGWYGRPARAALAKSGRHDRVNRRKNTVISMSEDSTRTWD